MQRLQPAFENHKTRHDNYKPTKKGEAMKHHVYLVTENLQLPGTYLTEEYNVDSDDDNDVLYRGLTEDFKKLTLKETREQLAALSFIKREFVPANPGVDPEVLKEVGGATSFLEMVFAGTAVVSLFFFKFNGLPMYQKVYNLELPE
jgi:hypothetical protein